ncbi:TPA: IS3 family transposase [Legionella pneumophila]|nr:IS3 family transposase [Legionella pneumophila]HBD7284214.1 IS3 family transposase [Legionella pneumophila]HEN8242204.1 IS3 family transposase [Legionella pneumophila]
MDERRRAIEPEHPILSVRQQAQLLGVPRSSIYYTPRRVALSDDKLNLLRLVDEVYTRYPFMGTRQMSDYITNHHHSCSRYQARWAYEQLGLRSVAPGPHTSKPKVEHKVYPYLLKNIAITRPSQVFSTDITYLRMKKGFVYLVAVIDWYSRFVLDWQLSISMDADFCIETLERVLSTNQCEIFNTDQGAQFTSKGFTDVLHKHQVQISMDGKGCWVDNVFVERLWRSVKYECTYLQEWDHVPELRKALQEYFHFYNYERPHQALAKQTPAYVHHHENILH